MSDSIQETALEKLKEVINAGLSRASNSDRLANEAQSNIEASRNRITEIEKQVKKNPKLKESLLNEYKLERKKAQAEEVRQSSHCSFSAIHRENAIGAYSYWAAITPEEFMKIHQEEILDLVYKYAA